jgi:hypothetical protein
MAMSTLVRVRVRVRARVRLGLGLELALDGDEHLVEHGGRRHEDRRPEQPGVAELRRVGLRVRVS